LSEQPPTPSASSVPRSFWEWAQRRPGHLAVRTPAGDSVSYGELLRRVNQFSHALRALRIGPGERIALLAANGRAYFEAVLGASQVGVHAVPVNTHLVPAEIAYIVQNCDARLVVTDATFAAVGAAALDLIGYPATQRLAADDQPGGLALSALLTGMPDSLPDGRIFARPMLYTSGTTGRPKGVVFPAQREVTPEYGITAGNPIMARRGMRTDPAAVSLVTGPLYHGAPASWGLQGLHHGHSVIVLGHWDSERALELIERERVTTAQMAPIHFFRLLKLPAEVRRNYDLSSLQVVSHAGAACPVEVKRQMMDWLGPVLYEYYASSEGYGTSIGPQEWLAHPGSVGLAGADGATMKVLDDDGRELGPDEVGTLWIKNPGELLSEYLNEPEKTEASHRDGFYTVGDQARIDRQGWVYIVDRRVDLILSGGVNIYPAEVERAISGHPQVAEVVAVGVPDLEWGQHVHVVIVPAAGAVPGDELGQSVTAHAARTLASFKLPRSVEFRDSLPYTASGKLLRRVLADEAASGPGADGCGAR
jgi:long-chain acyl-CoA synthetase